MLTDNSLLKQNLDCLFKIAKLKARKDYIYVRQTLKTHQNLHNNTFVQ